jgi:hypothetical protein
MIKRQQLELGVVGRKDANMRPPRGVSRPRAQWWFEKMREAVDRAENGHLMSHLERLDAGHGHN